MDVGGHEEVAFVRNPETGLRAIVAIHSTRLGPGVGGTRFRRYDSEDDALEDVLRLARAMTYKMAVSGLDLGGGKAVIIGDPATDKTPALLHAYGRALDGLAGRYLTAEDVGTTQADMDVIATETRFVTGTSRGSGDPSPATALGVSHAIAAVAEHLWGDPSVDGRHVVVSGVGKVGSALVGHLVDAGARVTVADVDDRAVDRVASAHTVDVVPPEKAHTVECDVFSPCALGGAISGGTAPELHTAAIVGAANNQLSDPALAAALAGAGIVYVPDYVANAGGVINIAEEFHPDGYDRARSMAAVARIRGTTLAVLHAAQEQGVTPLEAAERIADRRLAAASAEGRTS